MSLQNIDDPIFIARLEKGDEDAYLALVNTYHRKLFAYAMSLINDQTMAKDIVQNVLIRTWEYREKLSTIKSLNSFLHKSVYNEFINQYRKNQSLIALEKKYIETLDTIIYDEDTANNDQLFKLVTQEIQGLPKKCKRVFLLSKEEGLTNIEIAEFLNISLKSVEAQITRAYGHIRKSINPKLNGIYILLFGKKFSTENKKRQPKNGIAF